MLESTLKTGVGMLAFRSCSGPDGDTMPSMRGLAVPGYQVFVKVGCHLSEFSGSGGWGKEKERANKRGCASTDRDRDRGEKEKKNGHVLRDSEFFALDHARCQSTILLTYFYLDSKMDEDEDRNQQLLTPLRDSIVDKPPYISGILQLPQTFFSLFYMVARDGNAARFEGGPFNYQSERTFC